MANLKRCDAVGAANASWPMFVHVAAVGRAVIGARQIVVLPPTGGRRFTLIGGKSK